jgi:hypothetical protein
MDMSFDFQPVYPHHDLLVDLCQVEMAIDGLSEREDSERETLQPNLESRMQSLLDALDHLAVGMKCPARVRGVSPRTPGRLRGTGSMSPRPVNGSARCR